MQKVVVLGASGSIGSQTLDLLKEDRASFSLTGVSVGHHDKKIPAYIRDFPSIQNIFLLEEEKATYYQKEYPSIHFYSAKDGLALFLKNTPSDLVVNALVGFAGLEPSLVSLEENKTLLLANKESLVVGGELISHLLKEKRGKIIPIDSEHVALAKCLLLAHSKWKKMLITASGGAFRDFSREEIKEKKAVEALNHPNWKMGAKITIDCATMFNKGFECIEAIRLFSVKPEDIEILMHRESYVHSALLLEDGSYLAEVGAPDMHKAIRFALYGGKDTSGVISFSSFKELEGYHFSSFSKERYPAVSLCLAAYEKGGTSLAILNAANEEAVRLYLEDKISILSIEKIVALALHSVPMSTVTSYSDLKEADRMTRNFVSSLPLEALR